MKYGDYINTLNALGQLWTDGLDGWEPNPGQPISSGFLLDIARHTQGIISEACYNQNYVSNDGSVIFHRPLPQWLRDQLNI
ncbi:hypothetical protein LCGC14_1838100 [marine sediment metagenome]|uniref:Uncharacterized protein n=1 Tax=marine sediment metagenome TaxID=412755 RepID=A0A0F9GE54_9ZZZZ